MFKVVLALLSLVGVTYADPSRFLMQSGAVQPDKPQSLLQEGDLSADDELSVNDEVAQPESPAIAFKEAMAKLRADRDMFAKEGAEYERKALAERRAAKSFVH